MSKQKSEVLEMKSLNFPVHYKPFNIWLHTYFYTERRPGMCFTKKYVRTVLTCKHAPNLGLPNPIDCLTLRTPLGMLGVSADLRTLFLLYAHPYVHVDSL